MPTEGNAMRALLLVPLLLLAVPSLAQHRAPPSAPEHASEADSAGVLATIDSLFAALAARDADAILAVIRPEGVATASFTDEAGEAQIVSRSWPAFAARIAAIEGAPAERLIDPHVHVDGDIAMVWAPYEFTMNGEFSHCGIDHFDLVRSEGEWRVLNITWTQRTEGCAGR